MFSVKLTFSNNETLILNENQTIIPIVKVNHVDTISSCYSEPYTVWYHVSYGLIPSITELLCRCDFFKLLDSEKVYKTSSVVSIENM